MKSRKEKTYPFTERRRYPRVPVHWTVFLISESDPYPAEGITKDMSSQGFYCLVPRMFSVGESVRCALVIPSHYTYQSDTMVCLKAKARVLRVENLDGTTYGIACQIESYRVVTLNQSSVELVLDGSAA